MSKFGIDMVLDSRKNNKNAFSNAKQKKKQNKWELFIAMFLSDPSEAPIPSHPIFQADLLTTFIDEILYIYLAPCLATAFFRNHILQAEN
jgi:hypothetical protein